MKTIKIQKGMITRAFTVSLDTKTGNLEFITPHEHTVLNVVEGTKKSSTNNVDLPCFIVTLTEDDYTGTQMVLKTPEAYKSYTVELKEK